MFEWCDLARDKVTEEELEVVWSESKPRWENIAAGVDRIKWEI